MLRTENLPQDDSWAYELKLNGFRAQAIKSGGRVHLRSRNDKDFNARYPAIVQVLAALPDVLMSGRYASLWRRLIWRFPTSNAKDVPGTMFY